MSIDIYLEIDTGHPDGPVDVVDVGNYTHNCQPMWTHALESTGAEITRLCQFDEMSAYDAYPMLQRAYNHMKKPENEETYKAMNPPNGWGEYHSALDYLRRFTEACGDHPKCTIRTSC